MRLSITYNSLLAFPKHHVCLPKDAYLMNDKAAWRLFSLLKFDIIGYTDACWQFDLVDKRPGVSPYPEPRYSANVEVAW